MRTNESWKAPTTFNRRKAIQVTVCFFSAIALFCSGYFVHHPKNLTVVKDSTPTPHHLAPQEISSVNAILDRSSTIVTTFSGTIVAADQKYQTTYTFLRSEGSGVLTSQTGQTATVYLHDGHMYIAANDEFWKDAGVVEPTKPVMRVAPGFLGNKLFFPWSSIIGRLHPNDGSTLLEGHYQQSNGAQADISMIGITHYTDEAVSYNVSPGQRADIKVLPWAGVANAPLLITLSPNHYAVHTAKGTEK